MGYRALFDQSPAGIVVYDRALRVTDCNRKVLDLLGVAREQLVGLDMNELVDSGPVGTLRAALEGESGLWVGPYRTTLTGRDTVLSLGATPLRNAEGEVVGGLVEIDDTTEQAQLQARMRSQFKAMPMPTFAWQRREGATGWEFVLVDFNDAADAMAHGRMSTLLGKTLTTEISHHPTVIGDLNRSLDETGSEVILLAEDQDAVRKICSRMLVQSGHTVLAARDAAEALELAEAHAGPIDLLVTDMIMPGRSGRELYVELSTRRPGLRVLFISGHTNDEMLRRGELPPGCAFLQKPFTGPELMAAVRAILSAPSS